MKRTFTKKPVVASIESSNSDFCRKIETVADSLSEIMNDLPEEIRYDFLSEDDMSTLGEAHDILQDVINQLTNSKPYVASSEDIQSGYSSLSVEDVLKVLRNNSGYLLETNDAIYIADASASEYPGVLKFSYSDLGKSIATGLHEYEDMTAEEIVSDWIWEYASNPTIGEIKSAYQSAGQSLPDSLF